MPNSIKTNMDLAFISQKTLTLQEFSATCEVLCSVVQEVFAHDSFYSNFETVYRYCYNVVVSCYGSQFYTSLSNFLSDYLASKANEFCTSIVTDEGNFLQSTLTFYNKHKTASVYLSNILMYLDRAYCYPEKRTPVYFLAIQHFGTKIFLNPELSTRFTQALLSFLFTCNINETLENQLDNRETLFRDFLLMLSHADPLFNYEKENLQHISHSPNHVTLYEGKIYLTLFELPFLKELSKNYTKTFASLSVISNFHDFLSQVQYIIDCETNRAKRLFLSRSVKPVEICLIETLVMPHIGTLLKMAEDVMFSNVSQKSDTDLTFFVSLLLKVPEANKHIIHLTKTATESYVSAALSKMKQQTALCLIHDLLNFRVRCLHLVENVFHKNETFCDELAESFKNSIISNYRIASALVQSFDAILYRLEEEHYKAALLNTSINNLQPYNVSKYVAQVYGHLDLFRFITDKDFFEQMYRESLLQRLTGTFNFSTYLLEKNIIDLFTKECGNAYTYKLKEILENVMEAKKLQVIYTQTNVTLLPNTTTQYNFLIFGYAVWPSSPSYQTSIKLPHCLLTPLQNYERLYCSLYKKRHLQWKTCHGFGLISTQTNYGELHIGVTTFQMAVLLLFNERQTYTYKELLTILKPSNKHLFSKGLLHLCSSTCQNLLLYSSSKEKMSPESLNQNSLVSLSDTFSLSENISYMPLNYLPLHQENLYSYENRHTETPYSFEHETMCEKPNSTLISQERQVFTDAVLVRLMKSYKILSTVSLFEKAKHELQQRFSPSLTYLTERLTDLVERSFFTRDPKSPSLVYYNP